MNGLRATMWMVIAGCLAVGAGCGPSRPATTTVTGSVTYGGKPVSGASVAFVPEKGSPAVGSTDASGNFSITGALPGPARVTIAKTAAGPSGMPTGVPANPTPADMAKMAAAASGKKPEAVKAEIPEKYGRVAGSDLKAVVTTDAKKNVFTFDLKD